jgi:hypothetical protein
MMSKINSFFRSLYDTERKTEKLREFHDDNEIRDI